MATKKDSKKKNPAENYLRGEQMGARRTVIEEMFNDYYEDRRNIYLVNFFRGIFFGLGTFLGGTIIVGFIVWGLSFFVNIPGMIGNTAEKAQDSLQTQQK